MELHLRFTVDAGHCQGALDELGSLLVRQERAFLQRWHARLPSVALVRWLCMGGMATCFAGFVLCGIEVFSAGLHVHKTLVLQRSGFLIFIVAFAAMRRFSGKLSAWMHMLTLRRAGCRGPLRAVRFVRQAQRLVPFDVDFTLRGDLLTYSRIKDGRWQHAWHRQMTKYCRHGVAVQGHYVIAIFASTTALFRSAVVLFNDSCELPLALRALGLRTVPLESERRSTAIRWFTAGV